MKNRRRKLRGNVVPTSPGGGASTFNLTQDGIDFSVTGASQRQHVDETYAIVAPGGGEITFNSRGINAGVSSDSWLGGVMVEPTSYMQQGWDNRVNAGGTFGPNLIYDASLNVPLPFTIDVSGGPKTVHFYRGLDNVVSGGSNNGAKAIVQVTCYPSDPGANTIKPPGVLCAGGKPIKHTSDIDYNAFTPLAIPSGAIEPDWTAMVGYNRRPVVHTGFSGGIAGNPGAGAGAVGVCNPTLTQTAYPGYQAITMADLLLGAISNSASRNELINRIVRDSQDIYAQLAAGPTSYICNGGFGIGFRPLLFMGGVWLGDSAMQTKPSTFTHPYGLVMERFNEEGCCYLGSATAEFPGGLPRYGGKMISSASWPSATPHGAYHDNSDIRDGTVGSERDPHWLIKYSGVTQSGSGLAANQIKLAAGTTGITDYYSIYLASTGETYYVTPGGWNNTTKVATVSGNWTGGAPAAGVAWEYYNGGAYEEIIMKPLIAFAIAIKAAGKRTAYGYDALFKKCQKWVDDDGKLNPRYPWPYSGAVGSFASNARRFNYDGNGNWAKKFYDTYGPIWTW